MKAKILIVEDESILALMYKVTLQKSGFQIAAISSTGEQAVIEAERLKPDIILMDISLAGEIDGIEAVALIQSMSSIPVIYITGNNDSSTKERANITRPAGYLEKPVNMEKLLWLINQLCPD